MQRQQLHLKQSQTLSPQQIQLMKIIELSTEEFEQRIADELEENITLEEQKDDNEQDPTIEDLVQEELHFDDNFSDDTPNYQIQNFYQGQEFSNQSIVSDSISLQQHLTNQLSAIDLSEQEHDIADFLIGCIEEDGYIRVNMDDICDDLAFKYNIDVDTKTIEKILADTIQQLDPAGVGARNLKESILIQLYQQPINQTSKMAIDIVKNNFELFSKKNYERIVSHYQLDKSQLKKVIRLIETLNPKPGNGYNANPKNNSVITPDFYLQIEDNKIYFEVNGMNAPNLYISDRYKEMSSSNSKENKDAIVFVKQKIDAARWFIDAINQRRQTLTQTMNAIIDYQKEYFLTGDENLLRPMILKDIATKIDMDVSTISRVCSTKYVATPYGTKRLKHFFSEGIQTDDNQYVSNIHVKNVLQEIIDQEPKENPYPDDQLTELMKEKGLSIARRTIAKYREMLHIPVARLRKKI